MVRKELLNILEEQYGRCFYCEQRLNVERASIDHVIARSLGGSNARANKVACCVDVNRFFGNMTPKEKLYYVILMKGRFPCSR